MLISLRSLCTKHGIESFGVLHIGAHKAEERDEYKKCGASKVIWIEADPDLANQLKAKICESESIFDEERVFNHAIFDVNGKTMDFNVTNNTEASSLLDLGTHRKSYPEIVVDRTVSVVVRRIDSLDKEYPDLLDSLDFLNLDIQGAEFPALVGFGDSIKQFKWIYTEVNRKNVYLGNGMIWDIDNLLLQYGFFRKDTVFTYQYWGDAFYEKRTDLADVRRFIYKARIRFQYLWWAIADLPVPKLMIRALNKTKRLIVN